MAKQRTKPAETPGDYENAMRSVSDLIPYAKNARSHNDVQILKIASSIKEFGFTNPVLIDEANGIVAGHCRVLAAHKLGITHVPCRILAGLSDSQRRAYVIADNKLQEAAGAWDSELLSLELTDLRDDGFDLDLIGFSTDELSMLLDSTDAGLTDQDDIPSAPENPVSVFNDVWILGRHRVMVGDSANPQHVQTLTQGALADLCFTSPPYAQQRDYKGGVGDWDTLMQGVFGILPVKHDAQVLVNLGMVHRDNEWIPYWDGWVEWMRKAGWRRFGWYVWDQGPGLSGDWHGRLAPSHEFVFHFNRIAESAHKTKETKHVGKLSAGTLRRPDGRLGGGRETKGPSVIQSHKVPDSVIRIMRHKGALSGVKGSHPAVFPVDLVSEMLTAFSDPDDIVYEPFCGSGTQLISAQKNGRTCFGMEIAPEYVDIACKRFMNFSGQQAILESNGRTFQQVGDDRGTARMQL